MRDQFQLRVIPARVAHVPRIACVTRAVLIATVTLVTVAACGTAASARVRAVDLVATDTFKFSPAEIRARPGERITVRLRNPGVLAHDFATRGLENEVKFEVPAGQTGSATFVAPAKRGTYSFVCLQPGHEQAGMIGVIVVE